MDENKVKIEVVKFVALLFVSLKQLCPQDTIFQKRWVVTIRLNLGKYNIIKPWVQSQNSSLQNY